MDDIDRAQAAQQFATEAAIAAAQRQPRAETAPGGACLNCEEALKPGHHFCDADCREDYQRLQDKRANDQILRGLA